MKAERKLNPLNRSGWLFFLTVPLVMFLPHAAGVGAPALKPDALDGLQRAENTPWAPLLSKSLSFGENNVNVVCSQRPSQCPRETGAGHQHAWSRVTAARGVFVGHHPLLLEQCR